jgi:lipopolysaccharide/colanic/teichoic acid biosynthesis glycosyltransferase
MSINRYPGKPIRLNFVAEWGAVNCFYFVINYIAFGSLRLGSSYVKLLFLMNAVWFVVSAWKTAFWSKTHLNFGGAALKSLKSVLVMLYLTTLLIVLWGLTGFSRLHVLGTFAAVFLFEIVSLKIGFGRIGEHANISQNHLRSRKPAQRIRQSFLLAAFDFTLLVTAFLCINLAKTGKLWLNSKQALILLILIGFWMMMGEFTGKFERRDYRNVYFAFSPFIKSAFLMAASMALLVFTLHLFSFSRLQIFGSILLTLILEMPLCYLYFIITLYGAKEKDIESIEEAQEIISQAALLPIELHKRKIQQPLGASLRQEYLRNHPKLSDFIERNIDTLKIDIKAIRVLDTDILDKVEMIEDGCLGLFINLHRVNDFRRINRYFLEVHKKFFNGGYIVGRIDTLKSYREAMYAKYPHYIAVILYVFTFIFLRIFPKIPVTQGLYFAVTKGKNQHISKGELMGRLSFCGFKVVDSELIDDHLYFIAQKTKTPSADRNPSLGPLINLKRVGYLGETIYIKKLRTMHPYAEYLQDYVFEQNKLAANGKFKDDFRVTQWGRVFRKLWIDELPQFYNYLRGDLSLIGVRPLSMQYYSLYPDDLKELRTQFKPGLIPPYYADLPGSFEEILDSERHYLQNKREHPFFTDLLYLGKALFNIVLKKARSG